MPQSDHRKYLRHGVQRVTALHLAALTTSLLFAITEISGMYCGYSSTEGGESVLWDLWAARNPAHVECRLSC